MALVEMVPLLGKEQKYFILFAYSYQLIGIIIFYVNHNQLYSRDLITWILQNTLFLDYYTHGPGLSCSITVTWSERQTVIRTCI